MVVVVGHVVLELAEPVGKLMQLRECRLRLVDDGAGRVEVGILLEVADRGPAGDLHLPGVKLGLAGDDAQ